MTAAFDSTLTSGLTITKFSANITTGNAAKPSAAVADDYILAFIVVRCLSPTTAPIKNQSGWTTISSLGGNTTTAHNWLGYRKVQAGEPADYSFDWGIGASSTQGTTIELVRVTGADTATFLDSGVTNKANGTLNGSIYECVVPAITTGSANSVVVSTLAGRSTSGITDDDTIFPDDMTKVVRDYGYDTTGILGAIGFKVQAAAGSSGTATWQVGTGSTYYYGVQFAIKSAPTGSGTLTDIDGDESVYPGQSNVSYTGTGLSTAASARLKSTATTETSSMTITPTGDGSTAGVIDLFSLGAGVPYTDSDHTLTLELLTSGSALVASIGITVVPEAGFAVYKVSEAKANKTAGQSALAGLGTIPAFSQAKIPTSITMAGDSYTLTPELDAGEWTGRLTIEGYTGSAPGSITGAYLPGAGVWESLPLVLQVEDTAAPTLLSVEIGASGDVVYLGFDESVQLGANGISGLALTLTGGAISLTYQSGSGTDTLTCSLSRTVSPSETGNGSYTQPGDGIKDMAGNVLANIASIAIINGAVATGPTLSGITASVNDTDIEWSVTTDTSGGSLQILANSFASEDAEDIKFLGKSQSVTSPGVQNGVLYGLADGSYYVHIIHVHDVDSNVISTSESVVVADQSAHKEVFTEVVSKVFTPAKIEVFSKLIN